MEGEPVKHAYSVWAIPPENVRERLKKLMLALRSEFGGPEFEPHITVVRAISLTEDDALDKFRAACHGVKPYTATVEKVAIGTSCVFLLLHPTSEQSRMGLNQLALASLARTSQLGGQEFESPFSGCDVPPQTKRVEWVSNFLAEASSHCTGHFGHKTSTPYMPHLSLLYEDLSDEEKKKAQEKANVLDESIGNLSFEVTRLALYETNPEDKTLKSWKKIAECNLDAN
ncbi:unnamed protein product [Camellia sinensis]